MGCDFHSIGCYRLGNKIIKIRVRPSNRERFTEVSEINQPESLKEYFLENELNLDFQVQLGLNEKKTPVNNLLKMWKERDSPYVTIGKIHLHKQDITKYSNIEYENLSFDPFENKAGLRPVGRIMTVSYTHLDVYKRQILFV